MRARPTRVVLVLLCLMYAITYVDRVNVSTAAAVFREELHLSNTQVGLVFSAFAYPYLVFQILGGWIGDRFGARRALTIAGLVWASATLLMGFAGGLTSILVFRVLLGLGEGATFPVATRAMADWTPEGKRGFSQGITHSAARLGNALTPPLIAWLIALVTWRGSFVIMGVISVIWTIIWAVYFRDDPRDHAGITPEEIALLPKSRDRRTMPPVPWLRLIRRMLPVTVVYFCYGWTLWLYLAWIPQYFLQSHHLNLKDSTLFAAGVFLGGVFGDTLGGIVSDRVFERTRRRDRARRDLVVAGFLGSLTFMVPVLFFHDVSIAAVCLSLAFFCSEFTIGPMWAIPMDIAPGHAGAASGVMNSGSALAAILSPLIAGYVIDLTGNWELPFIGSIGLLLAGAVVAFWMQPDRELELPARPALSANA